MAYQDRPVAKTYNTETVDSPVAGTPELRPGVFSAELGPPSGGTSLGHEEVSPRVPWEELCGTTSVVEGLARLAGAQQRWDEI